MYPWQTLLVPRSITNMGVIMKITACINCGSQDIRSGTLQDGVLPGFTDGLVTYVCSRCNHRGLPVIFDSKKKYSEFVRARQRDMADSRKE